MSLAAVRLGLKDALGTVSGLNVTGVDLNPPDPCAMVGFPDELDPRAVLGPGTDYRIDVSLFVGLSDAAVADDKLAVLVDEVLAALDADPTLGGACSSMTPVRVGDFGRAPLGDGGTDALACNVTVEVMT